MQNLPNILILALMTGACSSGSTSRSGENATAIVRAPKVVAPASFDGAVATSATSSSSSGASTIAVNESSSTKSSTSQGQSMDAVCKVQGSDWFWDASSQKCLQITEGK